ncbi:sulfatase [Plantactinospora sp. BC1]|uniref:sulfatase n=1 Tax=Plantactinospora sp. BC1 TaxID=2108470 RepID=UPI000D17C235|nr:sulfatase [Plantactinospora sp. BC1]
MSVFTRRRRTPTDAPPEPPDGAASNGATPDGDAVGTDGGTDVPDTSDGGTDAGTPARKRGWPRTVAARLASILALLLVVFAMLAPNQLTLYTPGAFLRLPLEALVVVALVLLLPGWGRRIVAVPVGIALGLLAIVKVIDMGFFAVLARPFNPVFDWISFEAGTDYVEESYGRTGAVVAVVAAGLLAVGLLVLMTLSVLRLTRLAVRHRRATTHIVAALGATCVVGAVLGVQIVPEVPVSTLSYDRALQVRAALRDQEVFAAEARVDAFGDTPGDQLLTGLRGKDVVVAFVESYGRSAVEDPAFAPEIGATLDTGYTRLRTAGYAARSGWLTSPTAGGGSWLAHATLLSGLWIDNQQRYTHLVATDRMTLNRAFQRADWRTVGVMPGITQTWPEGTFFGYDEVHASKELGYRGPQFSWAQMPDQYTLSVFEQREHSTPDHPPVMATIPLVSSHAPWAPIPELIGWDQLGDGSIFGPMAEAGESPDDVWRDTGKVRTQYRRAVEYSLNTVVSYLERYGDEDLVFVFLGDHQPTPLVTGENASHDVPITIVAKDPATLERIAGWNWQEGLKPGPETPVWRMSDFRDRFLAAFGS